MMPDCVICWSVGQKHTQTNTSIDDVQWSVHSLKENEDADTATNAHTIAGAKFPEESLRSELADRERKTSPRTPTARVPARSFEPPNRCGVVVVSANTVNGAVRVLLEEIGFFLPLAVD